MGNSNSMVNFEHNIVTADYKLLGKSNTIRWGELFEMINSKTNQLVLVQEKYAVDLETYQKIAEDSTYRICLVHKNLVKIYGLAGGETAHGANKTYKVCIFFEHVTSNLQQAVKNRRGSPTGSDQRYSHTSTSSLRYFEEAELLDFLSQLINVLSFLQQNGISQRDITPDVCFIAKDGTLKMLDKKLIYNDTSAFETARQGNSNVFLTPAELDALSKDLAAPVENSYKADVFRVGLTLLECATLQRSSQIYDWNNQTINLDTLSARLIEVRERYSPAFYDPLREMLRFEENKRPDFLVLQRFLKDEASKKVNGMSPMGPKLVRHSSPSPKQNDRVVVQSFPIGNVSNFTLNIKPVSQTNNPRDSQSSQVRRKPKIYSEESETNFTELDDVTVNQVPFTEARNSVTSSTDLNINSPQKRLQNLIGINKQNKESLVANPPSLNIGSQGRLSRSGSFNKLTSTNKPIFQNPLTPANLSSRKDFSFANVLPLSQQPTATNTHTPLSRRSSGRAIFPATPNSTQSSRLNVGNFSAAIEQVKKNVPVVPQNLLQLKWPTVENKIPFTPGSQPIKAGFVDMPPTSYRSIDKSAATSMKDLNDNATEYFTMTSYRNSTLNTPKVSSRSINDPPAKVSNDNITNFLRPTLDKTELPVRTRNQNGSYSLQSSPKGEKTLNITETPRNSYMPGQTLTGNKRPKAEENPKDIDNDLVDSILRKMLGTAGISPSKALSSRSKQAEYVPDSTYPTPMKDFRLSINQIETSDRKEVEERINKIYNQSILRQSVSSSQEPTIRDKRDKVWSSTQPLSSPYGLGETREIERPKQVLASSGFVNLNTGYVTGYSGYKGNEYMLGSSALSTPTQVRKELRLDSSAVLNNVESLIKERQSALKSPINAQRESVTNTGVDVEDRFAMAMRRSQRSKDVMRGLSDKLSRLSVRSSSNDPMGRRNSGSFLAGGFMLNKIVDVSQPQN